MVFVENNMFNVEITCFLLLLEVVGVDKMNLGLLESKVNEIFGLNEYSRLNKSEVKSFII